MADLYETDIVVWSEQQSDLLRRLARGERVNDQIDWQNVAQEVEAVGRSERWACESYILQALLHDLKIRAFPGSPEVPHRRIEAHTFRYEASKAFAPSMRQRIDLAALHREALRRLPPSIDGRPPLPVPQVCDATLDDILVDTD